MYRLLIGKDWFVAIRRARPFEMRQQYGYFKGPGVEEYLDGKFDDNIDRPLLIHFLLVRCHTDHITPPATPEKMDVYDNAIPMEQEEEDDDDDVFEKSSRLPSNPVYYDK